MKAIKIIGMSLMTFAISGTVSAQREIGATSTEITVQEYFTDVKTLATFFVEGNIPANFPKYDSKLDKEVNKKAAATWAKKPDNNKLLSETGIAKLESFNSKATKRNVSIKR